MGRYDLNQPKKPIALISVALLIIAAVLGSVFFLSQEKGEQVVQEKLPLRIPKHDPLAKSLDIDLLVNNQQTPVITTVNGRADAITQTQENIVLPPLRESDTVFKSAIQNVSPALEPWMVKHELIQKYLTIVNDFAQGLHPNKHFKFLKLGKTFRVSKDTNGLYIARQSYRRYDALAKAVDKIEVANAIRLYQQFRPLFQQVYEGFSYADDHQLEDIFNKAAANILQAPIIEQNIRLIKPSVYYKYADKELEALNPVQKQMLRMGPNNTRIIQNKLRLLLEAFVKI